MNRAMRWTCLLVVCATFPAVGQHASDVSRLVIDVPRIRVWALYPPEKVLADESLPIDRKADHFSMSAAAGERESALIVVRCRSALNDIRFEPSQLVSARGETLPASAIKLNRMAYVPVDVPSGTGFPNSAKFSARPGAHPDILTASEIARARPGRNVCFWLTVHVPERTPPGVYTGRVRMAYRRPRWMWKEAGPPELGLEIRVYGFRLPQPSPLRNLTVLASYKIPEDWKTPEFWKSVCARAAEVRSAPDPLLPSPRVEWLPDGTVRVDAGDWERSAQYCLDELNAPSVMLPVRALGRTAKPALQGVYFLYHFPPVQRQRWPAGAPVFVANEQGRMRPEFKRAFGSYLRQMAGIVRRHGWQGRVFVTTMDEPYTYHTRERDGDKPENNFTVVREFAKLVKEEAPELKTFCTSDPVPELAGVIDHWCLRQFNQMALAHERAGKGDTITFIQNYRALIDFPLVSARTFGWLTRRIGAHGWVNSQTLAMFDRAWEDPVFMVTLPKAPPQWGAMLFFYPDPLHKRLLPSVRWAMMREGCDDYEYLWMLDKRVKTLAEDHPAKTRARALLALARTLAQPEAVVEAQEGQTHFANVQSNLKVWQLRCKVAELLEKLPNRKGP